jgi:hypothetical protein
LEAAGVVAFGVSMLLLGLELGRRLDKGRIGPPPDAVTRQELEVGLARTERRVELDLSDTIEKLEHLDDRIRKRSQAASRKPQDEPQLNGEAPRTWGNEAARRKLSNLKAAGRLGTSASSSPVTD